MTRAGYKITEIGEIPEEWEIKKIKDVCSIIRGNEPGSKSYNNSGRGYKFIRVSDVSKKVLKSVFVDSNPNKLIFCNKNDVLLVLDGVPGVVAKDFEGAISSGIRIIKPKTNKICNNFLFYILQHRDVQIIIENYTKGTTIKHANNAVDYINIPLPPLPEQQKIAEILSTADNEIQKVDKQIALTEHLKKGLMQKLLTRGIGHTRFKMTEIGEIPEEWTLRELGDKGVSEIVMGQSPPSSSYNTSSEGLPFFQGNADFGMLYPIPRVYCTKPLKVSETDDILISVRAPVGEMNIATFKCIIGRGLAAVRGFQGNTYGKFLYYYLKNSMDRLKASSNGSTFKAVSRNSMMKFKIALPPLPEQKKIAEILSTVDNKLELLRSKREKLNILKKGLMNDLLTGKIRVKV